MSDTFCAFPFYHLHVLPNSDIWPCGYSMPGAAHATDGNIIQHWETDLKDIRHNMLNGVKTPTCDGCYEREKHGDKSPRQLLKFQSGLTPDTAKLNPTIDDITSIDIRFSNHCNLACRMCGPDASSKIAAEWNKLGLLKTEKIIPIVNADTRSLDFDKILKNAKHVYFAGGEPLIMPEHAKCLDFMHKTNRDVDIRYSTNGTVLAFKDMYFPDIWKDMKKVHIAVSIDGIGEYFNFVRYGNDWQNVLSNTVKLSKLEFIDLSIRITASVFNILHLRECYNELKKTFPNVWVQINLLVDPTHCRADIIPDEIKKNVIAELVADGNPVFKPTIHLLETSTFSQDTWNQFVKFSNLLDQHRNQNILGLYPQFAGHM